MPSGLLLLLLFLVLYRIITRFIMPLLKVTANVRRQMKHMQNGAGSGKESPASKQVKKPGEYIEFEELR